MGSTDDTLAICAGYKVINLDVSDLSKARNSLGDGWQLYLDPWEVLESGHDEILWALAGEESCRLFVIQEEFLSKQTRLWKTGKFVRPVYESVEPTANKLLNGFIRSGASNRSSLNFKLLSLWKKAKPTLPEINYYLACACLDDKDYEGFLCHAKQYLFCVKSTTLPVVMTHYYCAIVNLYVTKDYQECLKNIIQCLVHQPTMAEFWCVLGDLFVRMKQFSRASAFYDNAILLGQRRRQDDEYPIEIDKYKEYPENMKIVCGKMLAQ